jgi:hypothetical protein
MKSKYKITIETLNGDKHQYEVESKSTSDKLCDSIFNRTPNVHRVTVDLLSTLPHSALS